MSKNITLTLLVAMAALCSAAPPALADETWICNFPEAGPDQPNPVSYTLRGQTLFEYGLGVPYRVLVDDDTAIVAVWGEGIAQKETGTGYAWIGVTTVAIDRNNGNAVKGGVGLYGGEQVPPFKGTCKRK